MSMNLLPSHRWSLFVQLFVLLSMSVTHAAHKPWSPNQVIAAYVYLLAKNTTWPGEDRFARFTIAVLEKGTRITESLEQITQDMRLKQRPIVVKHLTKLPDSRDLDDIQLLYVGPAFARKMGKVMEVVGKEKPVLVVSHGVADKSLVMVNIYYDRHQRARLQVGLLNCRKYRISQLLFAKQQAGQLEPFGPPQRVLFQVFGIDDDRYAGLTEQGKLPHIAAHGIGHHHIGLQGDELFDIERLVDAQFGYQAAVDTLAHAGRADVLQRREAHQRLRFLQVIE